MVGRATGRIVVMRAAMIVAPREARVVDAELARERDDDVIVRVRACGVCGSDQNAWRGVSGMTYPLAAGAPGHEIDGEVVAIGARASGLRVGMRVTGLAQNGFAEHVIAHAEELVPLPASRAAGTVLGEPLACAANAMARAGAAERVAVVGFGYLAALIALLGLRSTEWTAFSQRADSRALARTLGARAAFALDEVPSALWGSFPLVIEAAGAQRALDVATWLAAERGRLAIAGYHADGPRTVDMRTWNWKGLDVVNAHERAPGAYLRGLREGLAILERDGLDPAPLVTHRFGLDEVGRALATAEARPPGFVKAVVVP